MPFKYINNVGCITMIKANNNLNDFELFIDDFSAVGSSGYSGFGVRRTGSKPRVIGIRIRYRY